MFFSWYRGLIVFLLTFLITLSEYAGFGMMYKIESANQVDKIKKILIIIPASIKYVHGICNRYLTIQREAAKRGITVDIMDSSEADIVVGTLGTMMPENMLSFSLPKTYLKKYISGMYDAIHIGEIITFQSIAAALTFSYYKIPFTMMCHVNYDIYNKEYGNFVPEYFYPILARFISQKAKLVFAPTPGMIEQLKTRYGMWNRKMVCIPNGVDEKIFNTEKDEEYQKTAVYLSEVLKLKRPYLLCVSRVSPEKNLEEFFNLKFPGSKIMVGGGPMLETYKEKYKDEVIFLGVKRGKELASYYKNADVFIFPSLSETFGIVMIEAMACGTPVAAFPCTGPIDVVDSGVTGYLNHDLRKAVELCMEISRERVKKGSEKWKIEPTVDIFLNNLYYIPQKKRAELVHLHSSWI